jgi:hypothetical protein
MSYFVDNSSRRIDFSGNGISVSIIESRIRARSAPVDWFSEESPIPFGQIEDLKVESYYVDTDVPLKVYRNLTALQVTLWDAFFAVRFLRLLCPDPGAGMFCPALREIRCISWDHPGPFIRSLRDIARERERAGSKLELICIESAREFEQDLGGLRKHVKKLQVRLLEDNVL